MSRGYQARPKIHTKKGLFAQLSTVCALVLHRVSDSCKIGLKGYDFGGRSYVFRVVST